MSKESILHLKLPSDPRWADIAQKNIEDILTDHAYCEQKAASSCISIIILFSEYAEIVETLSPIVAEEWEHFERVLAQLKKRGMQLGRLRKDEYVNRLLKSLKKGGTRDTQVVERLLVSALIEARSCERFKMLWQQIPDPELSQFYYELMTSEAGHYTTFITLARGVLPREYVDKRWQELLQIEAEIIRTLDCRPDRMH